MGDSELLTIAEYAEKKNVSKQAVYARLKTDLKPFVQRDVKKVKLKSEALDIDFKVKESTPEDLGKDLAEKEAQITDLQQQIVFLKGQVTDLTHQIEGTRLINHVLQSQADDLREEVKSLRAEVEKLHDRLHEAHTLADHHAHLWMSAQKVLLPDEPEEGVIEQQETQAKPPTQTEHKKTPHPEQRLTWLARLKRVLG